MVYGHLQLLQAIRIGVFAVAIADVLAGLIAIIAISVIWNHQRTPIPLFGGEAYPYVPGPGEEANFLDDPYVSQYFLMGLVLLVLCAFTFGILLFVGVYKNIMVLMKLWKLCNILGFAGGVLFLFVIAFTNYSFAAMLLSFPLAFRLIPMWIVMGYIDTYESIQQWQKAQQGKNIEMAENPTVNGDEDEQRPDDDFRPIFRYERLIRRQ